MIFMSSVAPVPSRVLFSLFLIVAEQRIYKKLFLPFFKNFIKSPAQLKWKFIKYCSFLFLSL